MMFQASALRMWTTILPVGQYCSLNPDALPLSNTVNSLVELVDSAPRGGVHGRCQRWQYRHSLVLASIVHFMP